MKLAILSNGNANYSTKRLVEEAEKRGHDVKVVKYKNCYLSMDEKVDLVTKILEESYDDNDFA